MPRSVPTTAKAARARPPPPPAKRAPARPRPAKAKPARPARARAKVIRVRKRIVRTEVVRVRRKSARGVTTEVRRVTRRSVRIATRIVTDPVQSAAVAGLLYVSDTDPGLRRRRVGRGFVYLRPDGERLRDAGEIARVASIGIPPAWTDVWICPEPRGHIQATGRDARGRKQYRYHERWRAVRDETKYHRLIAFGQALPALRARVQEDLGRPGLGRERVLATVVGLLERTLIRVGNEEYARANESFGLTTLRDEHVTIAGPTLTFHFRGKSGKVHTVNVRDHRLTAVVRRCNDLPGHELFQYVSEGGELARVRSDDVNDYLREVTGCDFTAKDFRTWAGTVLAAHTLAALGAPASQTEGKRKIAEAVEIVSRRLGNTRAICRKCYVHPAVFDAFLDGSLGPALARGAPGELREPLRGLDPGEAAVMALLVARAAAAEVPIEEQLAESLEAVALRSA